jgi:hypothetical protein
MHGYNAYKTVHRIQCKEYQAYNSINKIQCIEYNTLNTMHKKTMYRILNHATVFTHIRARTFLKGEAHHTSLEWVPSYKNCSTVDL